MKELDPNFVARSRTAFLSNASLSLADIRQCVLENLTGTARRDTLSALDSIGRFFGKSLEAIRAERKFVRELLASSNGPAVGVTAKRYANVCSLVATAVRTYGEPVVSITKRIPLRPAWTALLDRIEIRIRRMALYRLACFCSAMGVAPDDVVRTVLEGFYAALEAEEVVKHPRKVLKHTVAHWNMCRKSVPEWPDFAVRTPLAETPYTFPLTAFPQAFQDDITRWIKRMTNPDFLDTTAPKKALKPTTIKGAVMIIRRFASALVHRGELRLDQVSGMSVFFEPGRFKSGLRFFLDRLDQKPTAGLACLAGDFRNIAKHYCRVDDQTLTEIDQVCARLGDAHPRGMTDKNRERLRQFDDPDKVARLLAFPAEERARALKRQNPVRAAKAMERALAVGLLIHCCLRMQNLRSTNLNTDIKWAGSRCFLSFHAEKVKNSQSLEFELPEDLAEMLKEYIAQYRNCLPGAEGPYLFPGQNGNARSHNALATGIKTALLQHAGLAMNPHLFRHAIGKIVVERNPELYVAMSKLLGHKRIDMTLSYYLGTETRAAGRHINRLLAATQKSPTLPKE